jgi:GT2 family glycosyltransferase
MKSPIYKAPGNTRTNGGFLLSCNFAIERALFDELNGFDENFKYPHLEDYDLRDRILAINEPILFTLEAKVVHPWRIMKSGIKLGHFEEMSIYYNAKNGNPSALLPLLKCITISHLLKIGWFVKHLKLSADILTAFKIMFQHLAIVGLNFNKWEKKYY